MSKIKLSIIIVHYKVKKELFECIKSIEKAQAKIPYEIIVVDNDEKKTIKQELRKFFPKVKYIKALGNIGFGAGNNLGAKHSRGEFLFFLNPDTVVYKNTIDTLLSFIHKDKKTGIVAPLLIDKKNKPYPLQGTLELTPLRGIIALSFLNKLIPNNPVSKSYWLFDWDKKDVKEVDVIPGTAFVIRRDVFEKVDGFDERFFLYFEESDLCRRVKKIGYKIYINPHSRIFHIWGASAKGIKTFDIFSRSRFLYFRKHFGFFAAVMVHLITNINTVNLLLGFVLILASFLRFFRQQDLMMFIGDQGWFYVSARDLVIKGEIPLVGITSSHTWLHQGALWIYMLAPVLWLFNFNPVAGAYFSSFLGIITVWLVYKVGKEMFSERLGLIAAFLYATSPLVIVHARMAYHTSPIPLFTLLLFYFVWKWVNGGVQFFPLVVFLLAVLYNFELATFTLVPIIAILLIVGFVTKKQWARDLINKRIIVLSFFGFFIPMIQMIVYDFGHGFPQTLKFIIWVGYKIAVTLRLYPPLHPDAPSETYQTMITFASTLIKRLIFLESTFIAWIILFVSGLCLAFVVFSLIKQKSYFSPFNVLFLFFVVPAVGYISAKTNSEGYVLIFFPVVMLMIALMFDSFMKYRFLVVPILILIFVISVKNSFYLVSNDYLMKNGYGVPMNDRINTVKKIIKESGDEEYNIVGKGAGSQYESFTMGYDYIAWWLGKQPSKKKTKLRFIIRETPKEVVLTKNMN